MKLRRIAALLAALILILPAQARADGARTFFAMDTVMTINAAGAGKALLDRCEAEVARLEALMSVTETDSEISRLNAYGSVTLSRDTRTVLAAALEVAEVTDGALDVTLYPVVRAWGFTTGSYRVPAEAELFRLRRNVNWKKITLNGREASVPEGVMVDLGAIAKGYASDRLAALLKEGGVTSGIIDLGGNVLCLGAKQGGSPWRVGIRDPRNTAGLAAILTVTDRAVVTSGSYERQFTADDGTVYGHIFDPATAKPADSGLISVSVIGKSGMVCDGLSTALYVMGREKAAALLPTIVDIDAILIDEDGQIWATPGLKDSLTPQGGYAEREIQWME